MTTTPCPHTHTTPVDAGHVCEACGVVLDRPALRSVAGGRAVPSRRRRLELVREARRALHAEDGDR
jgi:hypothetical protein